MPKKEEWEKVEGELNIWLPEKEGEELVGIVKELKEGRYGTQAVIEKADGEEATTPSHKVLQNRLSSVNVGDTVRIVRGVDLPPQVRGHKPTTMYDVFVKK